MANRLLSLDKFLGQLDEPTKRLEGASAATADPAAAAFKRGFAAANARFAAVMESAAGKANIPVAVFMLTESDASAETIIAKLPNFGRAAAGAASSKAGEDPLKLWGEVQGASADDAPPAGDLWAEVQGSAQPIGRC